MKRKIARNIFTAIAILCLAAALVLGWRLFEREMEYKKGQEGIEEIYRAMDAAAVDLKEEPETGADTGQERLLQYAALHQKNPDMAGWIRIDGTRVDYPVMHTPQEPEFYFHRDFEGEYSAYGMIFADGDCLMDGSDPNLLIYGHHMRNGSMFAQIEDYQREEFWREHPVICFDTLKELGRYEVAGAFKRPAGELDEDFKNMLLARTEEDYKALWDMLRTSRFYDTGVEPVPGRRLITLTTCEYTQGDGRFFVVAQETGEQ